MQLLGYVWIYEVLSIFGIIDLLPGGQSTPMAYLPGILMFHFVP